MIDQDEYRCFIGNLSWSTSDRDLKEAFKKFDHLLDAKVNSFHLYTNSGHKVAIFFHLYTNSHLFVF